MEAHLKEHESDAIKIKLPAVSKKLILITVLLVSVVFLFSYGILPGQITGSAVSTIDLSNEPVKGDPEAKVTIVEFSDFNCPACKGAVQVVDRILNEYNGKVKIVFKNYPLASHEGSFEAAMAAECAHEQGRFWDYHDKLFQNQGSFTPLNLKVYAAELGLDRDKFNQCLNSGKYEEEVRDDIRDGNQIGIKGTPTFLVNGRVVLGADYGKLKEGIENSL